MHKRFQPSVVVRASCSLPLLLLAMGLVVSAVANGGLSGWLAIVGAALVLVLVARGWVIRVDDLGDKIRVTNWLRVIEVPWSDVERFEFDGAVSVRRTNLPTLPLAAFPASSRDLFGILERRNTAAFRALEAARKRHRRQARSQRRA